jgi:hypothetical protein
VNAECQRSFWLGLVLTLYCACAGCCHSGKSSRASAERATASMSRMMISLSRSPDLIYATESFAGNNKRWPTNYAELTEFVNKSEGVLRLNKYEEVRFESQPDGWVVIALIRSGGPVLKLPLPRCWPMRDQKALTTNPLAGFITSIADQFDFYTGYEISYAAQAFKRQRNRWPSNFVELQEFVDTSAYLHLPALEDVNLVADENGELEIQYPAPGKPITMNVPADSTD